MGGRANLIGLERFQEFSASPQDSEVGAEILVSGAGQKVTVPSLDVHPLVRRVVDGIHKNLGSEMVGC